MKTNQIILTVAFLFATLLTNAQDKYEFMIIELNTYKGKLCISIDGREFIKEDVIYPNDAKSDYNANPFLQKVKDYQDKGWEVMSFNPTFQGSYETYFACLRIKKKDKE